MSRVHLQLSGAESIYAKVPGPVIGPNARVRPCSDLAAKADMDVICLDVDSDGKIERGYTIKRMVALQPEEPIRSARARLFVAAGLLIVAVGGFVLFG